jgi:hypothetical protein
MVYRKQVILLKGHGNGVFRNWFLMSPLHYLSNRSDFGFEFAEILVFENDSAPITDTGSRYQRKIWILQAILSTPRLTDAGSQFSNTNISENVMPKSKRLER